MATGRRHRYEPAAGSTALEPEGRGARLFLVHEGFGPDDPYQVPAHRITGGGRRSMVGERLGQVLDKL
ncbi:hypothetical protein [Streptomyces sp. NPDC059649]|uniref:hypothetical protein n=1 Tax=Streptomyces sp. NPDC059649 TaxID=3346895 RepID=UPI0036C2FA0D